MLILNITALKAQFSGSILVLDLYDLTDGISLISNGVIPSQIINIFRVLSVQPSPISLKILLSYI